MKKNIIIVSILIVILQLIACQSNTKQSSKTNKANSQVNNEKDNEYPKIVDNYVAIEGDTGKWDDNLVHTFSIIEYPGQNNYKYWGYYGLDNYNEKNTAKKKAGLAFSKDLKNWVKFDENPIIQDNCRWPTAVVKNGKVYLFYAQYNENGDSRIVMQSAGDGIHFGDITEIVPYQTGEQNQNPFIYYNRNDNNYYLFYYNGTERSPTDKHWNIMYKKTSDLEKIAQSEPVLVISSKQTMAAPSVVYYKDTYYLLVEEFNNSAKMDRWVTNAFYSDKIDSGYKRVGNNPILANNDACAFQYLFDGKLYVTYSHALNNEKSKWNLKIIQVK